MSKSNQTGPYNKHMKLNSQPKFVTFIIFTCNIYYLLLNTPSVPKRMMFFTFGCHHSSYSNNLCKYY